jgi:tetratricopeptide (TPR) repeat protein
LLNNIFILLFFSNIELLSFEKEPVTAEEKLAFGTVRKNEGNEFVKIKQWELALTSYQRGLSYTQYLHSEDETIKKQQKELVLSLFLNKSLVCLKLEKYGDTFQACDEALRLDNDCGKAYYRRALCYEVRGEWENAKRDLYYAAVCCKNDKTIRDELEKVNKIIKKEEEKKKKQYSNLFDKLKAEEEKEKIEREKREEEERKRKEKEKVEEEKRVKEEAQKAKEVKPTEETKPAEIKPTEETPKENTVEPVVPITTNVNTETEKKEEKNE